MDKLQKEFEAWLESEFGMWAIQARPGVYGSEQIQDMWKAWQAALSANGGEAVGWLVSRKGDGTFPRFYFDKGLAEDMVKEVELPPSATMSPVYTHPAPPSVAVPEGWIPFPTEAWLFLTGEGPLAGRHFGDIVCDDKTGRDKPFWWRSHIRHMLTAAPSPDHSGDANKMVDVECCCGETEDAWRLCPSHGPNHIPDAGKVVPSDWEGWACHKAGKMPRLYGEKSIAEVNCDTENGERLVFLSAAPSAPENEVKAQGITWAAEYIREQNSSLIVEDLADDLDYEAARLRTAGDEGEE